MKSAALLAAMLSGLCAEAMAVPIGFDQQSTNIVVDEPFVPSAPTADLNFSKAEPVAEAIFDDDPGPDEGLYDVSDQLSQIETWSVDGSDDSDSLRIPATSPFGSIFAGLGVLCFLASIVRGDRASRRRTPQRIVRSGL